MRRRICNRVRHIVSYLIDVVGILLAGILIASVLLICPFYIWKSAAESRRHHYRIRIAINRETGSALLLFKASDSDIVQDAADAYHRFEIELTPRQRAELIESLDYYERIRGRKGQVRGE